jgi:cobalt-zinc-cadmium efflux system outer membrane protein
MILGEWLMKLALGRGTPVAFSVAVFFSGCASGPEPDTSGVPYFPFTPSPKTNPISPISPISPVQPVSHVEVVAESKPARLPFENASELTEGELIEAVLLRNPTLDQMTAAWRAAAARYPQVTSLDDPRVGGYVGPGSIGSPNVDFAYRVEVSQAFPYPGKRQLKGENALREADAAGADVENTRLQLVEAARSALADYFLVTQATDVGEENLKLLQRFHRDALSQFRVGKVSLQDSLQAEVAIARQRERLVTFERQRKVAQARLNTLMHLPPDHPLPPPPKKLDAASPLAPIAKLRERAIHQRPDIRAVMQRVAAEEASVALAMKEYKPDFEAMAAYDAWWQSPERALRPMVGLRANLPVRFARRSGAVQEAEARLAQRRAELARLTDRVQFETQEAFEQVRESERVLELFEKTTLPAARRNVELAISEYAVNKVTFLSLIEAQRNLVELRDRYYEVMAELLRRQAALERVTGGPVAKPFSHRSQMSGSKSVPIS